MFRLVVLTTLVTLAVSKPQSILQNARAAAASKLEGAYNNSMNVPTLKPESYLQNTSVRNVTTKLEDIRNAVPTGNGATKLEHSATKLINQPASVDSAVTKSKSLLKFASTSANSVTPKQLLNTTSMDFAMKKQKDLLNLDKVEVNVEKPERFFNTSTLNSVVSGNQEHPIYNRSKSMSNKRRNFMKRKNATVDSGGTILFNSTKRVRHSRFGSKNAIFKNKFIDNQNNTSATLKGIHRHRHSTDTNPKDFLHSHRKRPVHKGYQISSAERRRRLYGGDVDFNIQRKNKKADSKGIIVFSKKSIRHPKSNLKGKIPSNTQKHRFSGNKFNSSKRKSSSDGSPRTDSSYFPKEKHHHLKVGTRKTRPPKMLVPPNENTDMSNRKHKKQTVPKDYKSPKQETPHDNSANDNKSEASPNYEDSLKNFPPSASGDNEDVSSENLPQDDSGDDDGGGSNSDSFKDVISEAIPAYQLGGLDQATPLGYGHGVLAASTLHAVPSVVSHTSRVDVYHTPVVHAVAPVASVIAPVTHVVASPVVDAYPTHPGVLSLGFDHGLVHY